MGICRVAMMGFMWGDVPRYDGGRLLWSDRDLRDMIQWCEDMISEGLTHEPIDRFDLQGFIEWARPQITGATD